MNDILYFILVFIASTVAGYAVSKMGQRQAIRTLELKKKHYLAQQQNERYGLCRIHDIQQQNRK